jgi:hypothetical protein
VVAASWPRGETDQGEPAEGVAFEGEFRLAARSERDIGCPVDAPLAW